VNRLQSRHRSQVFVFEREVIPLKPTLGYSEVQSNAIKRSVGWSSERIIVLDMSFFIIRVLFLHTGSLQLATMDLRGRGSCGKGSKKRWFLKFYDPLHVGEPYSWELKKDVTRIGFSNTGKTRKNKVSSLFQNSSIFVV
jgi:hypothetical protein